MDALVLTQLAKQTFMLSIGLIVDAVRIQYQLFRFIKRDYQKLP